MVDKRRTGRLDAIEAYLRKAVQAPGDLYIGVHADDSARVPQALAGDATVTQAPNNAYIAAANEFGIGVTERPFLRPTIGDNLDGYKELLATELRKNLRSDRSDPKRPYHVVGVVAVGDVQATLDRGVQPPPTEATLAWREHHGHAGQKSLIVTGQLKSSISYSVGDPDAEDDS